MYQFYRILFQNVEPKWVVQRNDLNFSQN